MQMQRTMVYTSSPAVRVFYTWKAPHIFTLTVLDKTPSCQEPPSLQPGLPSVVLCALTAAPKYEAHQEFCLQQTVPGNQRSVRVSSSLHSHPASIQRKDTAARWRNVNDL